MILNNGETSLPLGLPTSVMESLWEDGICVLHGIVDAVQEVCTAGLTRIHVKDEHKTDILLSW